MYKTLAHDRPCARRLNIGISLKIFFEKWEFSQNENPYFSKKYFYYAVDIKAVGSVFEKLKNVDFQLILTRNLNQFSFL